MKNNGFIKFEDLSTASNHRTVFVRSSSIRSVRTTGQKCSALVFQDGNGFTVAGTAEDVLRQIDEAENGK